MKRALIALVLLSGIGGAVYYFFFRPDPNAGRPRVTVRATRGELVEYAGATGTIQPDVQVEIRSRESGEVIEVMVQEGQVVTAGQTVATHQLEHPARPGCAPATPAEPELARTAGSHQPRAGCLGAPSCFGDDLLGPVREPDAAVATIAHGEGPVTEEEAQQ